MTLIFVLLIIFQLKHFVADYPLQNRFMLGKFAKDWSFVLPLLSHAGVHGAFTLIICLAVNPSLWWLCFVDLISHFFIDRLKAGQKYLGRYKALSAMEMKDNLEILYEERVWHLDNHGENILRAIRHNQYFWWCLGGDQASHHLVHYLIIACLIGAI